MTADEFHTATLFDVPGGSACRSVDDEWDVLDPFGRTIGIIWRTSQGWRCAPLPSAAGVRGTIGRSFDEVLQHALRSFPRPD